MREIKALVRRLDSLIEVKQQEVNRLDVADAILANDIEGHIDLLSKRIDELRK